MLQPCENQNPQPKSKFRGIGEVDGDSKLINSLLKFAGLLNALRQETSASVQSVAFTSEAKKLKFQQNVNRVHQSHRLNVAGPFHLYKILNSN